MMYLLKKFTTKKFAKKAKTQKSVFSDFKNIFKIKVFN